MLDELKKPLEEIVTSGKDAISNAVKDSDASKAFFEKLSEKFSEFAGRSVVENKELSYNKEYDKNGGDRQ